MGILFFFMIGIISYFAPFFEILLKSAFHGGLLIEYGKRTGLSSLLLMFCCDYAV